MLSGARALVIEDEYLIALEIQRILEAAGAVATIGEHDLTAQDDDRVELAIVSIRPDGDDEAAFCKELRRRGIAVVAISAAGEHADGIPGLDAIPVVIKPFADNELIAAAAAALLSLSRPETESTEVRR